MHKINWNNTGGHPLRMDDLDFMQESAIDAVNGIISALQTAGQNHFILSGCKQQANFDVTSGWIVLNGELRKFNGYTAPPYALPYPSFYAFAANDYYDTNLTVTYKDQSQKDIYNYRSAQVVVLSSPDANKPAVGSLQRWDDPWHEVGTTNEPALGAGWTNGGQTSTISNAAFRKDINGEVILKGGVSHLVSSSPLTAAFTLPSSYRPQNDIFLPLVGKDTGTGNPANNRILIKSNGEVYPSTGVVNEYWLDGITFNTL